MVVDLDRVLAEFSEQNLGVFTRGDALETVGFTPQQAGWWVSSGQWVEVEEETYRLAGTPLTERALLRAVVAGVSKPAAISHGTAACEHGIEVGATDEIHMTVEGRTQLTRRYALVHRTTALPAVDRTETADGTALTTAERTVVDLSAQRGLGERLSLVDDALCGGAAERGGLHERATALSRGRPGVAHVADVTGADAAPRFRSWLERTAHGAFVDAGLPPAEWNVEVHDRRGFTVAELDALWRWAPLAVELDGLRFHSSPKQRQRDVRRDRRVLIEAGVPVVRYNYLDIVRRRLEVVSEIRTALEQRSAV
jgi:hypothetical protein